MQFFRFGFIAPTSIAEPLFWSDIGRYAEPLIGLAFTRKKLTHIHAKKDFCRPKFNGKSRSNKEKTLSLLPIFWKSDNSD